MKKVNNINSFITYTKKIIEDKMSVKFIQENITTSYYFCNYRISDLMFYFNGRGYTQ